MSCYRKESGESVSLSLAAAGPGGGKLPRACIAVSLFIALGAPSRAVGDHSFAPIASEAVRSECTDCHIAYQPEMLPQRSWRKLISRLEDHFGETLTLDAETTGEVLRYLSENASDTSRQKGAREFLRGLRPGDSPVRITATPRWRKKHHELPEKVWSDPRIAFKGQCEICHVRAEQGLYDEDAGLRVPGPNGTWRRWEDD